MRSFGRDKKSELLRIIIIAAESRIRVSAREQPFVWIRIPSQVSTTCVLCHESSMTQANKMNLDLLA